MPRASFVAVIGSILSLAFVSFSPPALAASAVPPVPAPSAPMPGPELVAANPGGTSSIVAVINYESVAGRAMRERLVAFGLSNPDIKIVVRPISGGGPLSEFLAKAAYAAARQGKFVAFHEAALGAQIAHTWYSLRDNAALLGIDWPRFQKDFMDPQIVEAVRANAKFAEEHKIAGSPAFVAGGQVLAGPWEALDLRQLAVAAKGNTGVVPTAAK
jgi:protein-disulfide isomerase